MHDDADRLLAEARNLDRRADDLDQPPTSAYADHLRRRADHCRRLARSAAPREIAPDVDAATVPDAACW